MIISKNIFKIKFAYVTNTTAKTCIKNHIYHYATPCKTVMFDSDGRTGDHTDRNSIDFFNKLLAKFFKKFLNYRGSS
jgi:hypothetical protein